ncbi:hypothetical protein ACCO45_013403 [Purpureocillium lilacinum]|uniref:Uncharacterized protein n=1 Tax=Purpureocillium lilacinum TaxID=33203 RepID=A0ACC4D850_PURLI
MTSGNLIVLSTLARGSVLGTWGRLSHGSYFVDGASQPRPPTELTVPIWAPTRPHDFRPRRDHAPRLSAST